MLLPGPSAGDLPAKTTVPDNLCEHFIPQLQARDPVIFTLRCYEKHSLPSADFLQQCDVIEFKVPQNVGSNGGFVFDTSRSHTQISMMILGGAMILADVDLRLCILSCIVLDGVGSLIFRT